jgi:hypothetical protein
MRMQQTHRLTIDRPARNVGVGGVDQIDVDIDIGRDDLYQYHGMFRYSDLGKRCGV